jgi:hypothetical protein
MEKVTIGVDPHKLSATIEVVDVYEKLLGSGRFTTDRAGYIAMRTYAKTWPDRVWAVEGANGVGRPLAQRLLEAGEHVVDVPAKLAARAAEASASGVGRLRRPRGQRQLHDLGLGDRESLEADLDGCGQSVHQAAGSGVEARCSHQASTSAGRYLRCRPIL